MAAEGEEREEEEKGERHPGVGAGRCLAGSASPEGADLVAEPAGSAIESFSRRGRVRQSAVTDRKTQSVLGLPAFRRSAVPPSLEVPLLPCTLPPFLPSFLLRILFAFPAFLPRRFFSAPKDARLPVCVCALLAASQKFAKSFAH